MKNEQVRKIYFIWISQFPTGLGSGLILLLLLEVGSVVISEVVWVVISVVISFSNQQIWCALYSGSMYPRWIALNQDSCASHNAFIKTTSPDLNGCVGALENKEKDKETSP
ncbi:hypothetical protein GDO86_019130 [Hymenochirus boettgeri]|uniref:Uncharacterized protein n=1 Tax=Hymenochirus boettgeri TaxID=247094 RepID=A0A8T2ICX7_9PIPI|nr:hypothetical protein GDO86_019130 [Hymenochirus boettgeri]